MDAMPKQWKSPIIPSRNCLKRPILRGRIVTEAIVKEELKAEAGETSASSCDTTASEKVAEAERRLERATLFERWAAMKEQQRKDCEALPNFNMITDKAPSISLTVSSFELDPTSDESSISNSLCSSRLEKEAHKVAPMTTVPEVDGENTDNSISHSHLDGFSSTEQKPGAESDLRGTMVSPYRKPAVELFNNDVSIIPSSESKSDSRVEADSGTEKQHKAISEDQNDSEVPMEMEDDSHGLSIANEGDENCRGQRMFQQVTSSSSFPSIANENDRLYILGAVPQDRRTWLLRHSVRNEIPIDVDHERDEVFQKMDFAEDYRIPCMADQKEKMLLLGHTPVKPYLKDPLAAGSSSTGADCDLAVQIHGQVSSVNKKELTATASIIESNREIGDRGSSSSSQRCSDPPIAIDEDNTSKSGLTSLNTIYTMHRVDPGWRTGVEREPAKEADELRLPLIEKEHTAYVVEGRRDFEHPERSRTLLTEQQLDNEFKVNIQKIISSCSTESGAAIMKPSSLKAASDLSAIYEVVESNVNVSKQIRTIFSFKTPERRGASLEQDDRLKERNQTIRPRVSQKCRSRSLGSTTSSSNSDEPPPNVCQRFTDHQTRYSHSRRSSTPIRDLTSFGKNNTPDGPITKHASSQKIGEDALSCSTILPLFRSQALSMIAISYQSPSRTRESVDQTDAVHSTQLTFSTNQSPTIRIMRKRSLQNVMSTITEESVIRPKTPGIPVDMNRFVASATTSGPACRWEVSLRPKPSDVRHHVRLRFDNTDNSSADRPQLEVDCQSDVQEEAATRDNAAIEPSANNSVEKECSNANPVRDLSGFVGICKGERRLRLQNLSSSDDEMMEMEIDETESLTDKANRMRFHFQHYKDGSHDDCLSPAFGGVQGEKGDKRQRASEEHRRSASVPVRASTSYRRRLLTDSIASFNTPGRSYRRNAIYDTTIETGSNTFSTNLFDSAVNTTDRPIHVVAGFGKKGNQVAILAKRKILHPSAIQETSGLRRSLRNRVAPCRHYLGEFPVYKLDRHGNRVLVDVTTVRIREPYLVRNNAASAEVAFERQRQRAKRNASRRIQHLSAKDRKKQLIKELKQRHRRCEDLDKSVMDIRTPSSSENDD